VGVFAGQPVTTAAQARAGAELAAQRSMWGISGIRDLIPVRGNTAGSARPLVTADTALRHSAVWACLRLRADLISTLPVHVKRAIPGNTDGLTMDVTPPMIITNPGGPDVRFMEWAFSTQWDLDRLGNVVGIISERDGNGLPSRIDLQSATRVAILGNGPEITGYRIGGSGGTKVYDPADIWHEKQFTTPGIPVGLSPVSYAALVIGRYLSVEEFAASWFAGGGVPRSRLRNTAKKLVGNEATVVKEAWKASIATGEPFVHGMDWEYDMIQAAEASADWLEAQKASVLDIARWFGCPADLIDAAVSSGTRIVYANITQRHLAFLVTQLGPAISRREDALGTLTAQPRTVELDTGALLRMDPTTRAAWSKTMIDSRQLAPSEARAAENRPPFTAAPRAEFDRFWPAKSAPAGAGGGAPSTPALPPGDGQGEGEGGQ
jgi:HK97 family phage portal protein